MSTSRWLPEWLSFEIMTLQLFSLSKSFAGLRKRGWFAEENFKCAHLSICRGVSISLCIKTSSAWQALLRSPGIRQFRGWEKHPTGPYVGRNTPGPLWQGNRAVVHVCKSWDTASSSTQQQCCSPSGSSGCGITQNPEIQSKSKQWLLPLIPFPLERCLCQSGLSWQKCSYLVVLLLHLSLSCGKAPKRSQTFSSNSGSWNSLLVLQTGIPGSLWYRATVVTCRQLVLKLIKWMSLWKSLGSFK